MTKEIWLGIVHIKQLEPLTVQELTTDPKYTELVKTALTKCKQKGDVAKEMKKLANKNPKTVVKEQVFLTDSKPKSHLENASFIIDVDTKAVIKNRFGKERQGELVEMYLERYQSRILEFKRQFGNKNE